MTSAVQFNDLRTFLVCLTTSYKISSVLYEDMSTYTSNYPPQYYFMVNDDMVANWSTEGNMGSIRGIRAGSNWSIKGRKFKRMSYEQFKSHIKRYYQ